MTPSAISRRAGALALTLVLTSCGGVSNRDSLPVVPSDRSASDTAALQAGARQTLYVADESSAPGSIGEYTLSGILLRRVPATLVSKNHPSDAPARIAVDGAGILYVYNRGLDTPTVTEYASGTTSLLRTIETGVGGLTSYGLLAASSGALYALNEKTPSAGGNLAEYEPATIAPSIVVRSGLFNPKEFALDASGILYVANRTANVRRFKNTIVEFAGGSATPLRTIQEGAKRPYGTVVDAQGTLYVLYATVVTPSALANRIDEFPKGATKPARTIRLANTPGYVASLRADSSGVLYVYNQGTLYVYPRGAKKPSTTIAAPSGRFFSSLAFDATNNLYAVTQGGGSASVVFFRHGSTSGRTIVTGTSYLGPILIGP